MHRVRAVRFKACLLALASALMAVPAAHAQPVLADPGLLTLCLAAFRAVTPDTLWTAWSLAPQTLVPLTVAAFLYARGAHALRLSPEARLRHILCFVAGWLLLLLAFVSPLCRASASIAIAHMIQHVVIVAAAPPLLILGSAGPAMAAALPGDLQRFGTSVGRAVTRLSRRPGQYAAMTVIYGLAIWLWHAPLVYEWVLQSTPIHVIGYASLTLVSLLFWSATISLARSSAAGAGGTAIALLITTIHTGFLGALLTLSPFPWFPSATGGAAWGLTPLEDQQIAGVVMWVPMAGIYLVGTLWLLYRALDELERSSVPYNP